MIDKKTLILFPLILLLQNPLFAAKKGQQGILPPIESFEAYDTPYDGGSSAMLEWDVRPSDGAESDYEVFVSLDGEDWKKYGSFASLRNLASEIELPFWAWEHTDKKHALEVNLNKIFKDFPARQKVYFKLKQTAKGETAESETKSAVIKGNLFNMSRLNNFILVIVLMLVFFWSLSHAKKRGFFIRKIAGLDAIDEAIGRATEMGRPIYYVPGIGSMTQMSTIASTTILGEVSKKVASYETSIKVPHYDAVVMTICKEIVKEAYTEKERPDAYREDINFFVTQDQFSYAASVDGMLHREKPAACFFIGYFMAESLLLAEVGATTGAIQIAGTDVESQLPFFFTACDYTLIGEELYAAGAYLSREPMMVSALKVQDYGKMFVVIASVLGITLTTIGALAGYESLIRIISNLFEGY